jgi:hypothetical protein
VVAFAVGLGACGGDGGPGGSSVSTATLSGMINSVPWTFVAGQTDSFLSSNSDTFFANLFDMPFADPCNELRPAGVTRSIILNIPKKVGHYSLSLALNQTFSYDPDQNDIATSGELDVNTLTATSIQGGVKMAFEGKDSVDGQFEIAICP